VEALSHTRRERRGRDNNGRPNKKEERDKQELAFILPLPLLLFLLFS
jgi:hypothetical protein